MMNEFQLIVLLLVIIIMVTAIYLIINSIDDDKLYENPLNSRKDIKKPRCC